MSYFDAIGGGGYDFAYAGGMGYVGAGGFGGGQPVSFNTDYYGPVENQGITGFINAGGSSLWAAYGAPTMGAVGGLWRDFSGLTGISFSLDNMMTAMFAGMAYMFAGPTFAPPALLGAAAPWMGAPGPIPAGGPGGAPMYAPPMAMQARGSARETDAADAPEKTGPEKPKDDVAKTDDKKDATPSAEKKKPDPNWGQTAKALGKGYQYKDIAAVLKEAKKDKAAFKKDPKAAIVAAAGTYKTAPSVPSTDKTPGTEVPKLITATHAETEPAKAETPQLNPSKVYDSEGACKADNSSGCVSVGWGQWRAK